MAPQIRILHVTSAHNLDDVRILERECKSLAGVPGYNLALMGIGESPSDSDAITISIGSRRKSRLFRFSTDLIRIWHAVNRMQADILHFHDPELLPVLIHQALKGRIVIWDAHEDYAMKLRENGDRSWIPTWLRLPTRLLLDRLLLEADRRSSAVIAATPAIEQLYGNPLTAVVGNEVRLSDFRNCQPAFDSVQVLYTGSPSEAHLFLEVVQALAVASDDLVLAVAGRGYEEGIWSQAQALLQDRLVHLGWLNREKLACAMSQSLLGVATYADWESYRTAAPTKIFEFLAAGLPVVATPNESILEMKNQGAPLLLATGFEKSHLEDAFRNAIVSQQEWLSRSRRSREWVRQFGTWTDSETRLFNLYRKLVDLGKA